MKASAVLVAAAAAVVSAQSDACQLTSIPSCALPAIQAAVSSATKCATTDYACVCASQQALTGAATPGVLQACGQDTAINKVLPAVQAFCSAITSGKCASGSTSSSSAAQPSSTSTAVVATSTVTPTMSLSTTVYATTTSAPTGAPTYSANGTSSGKPTTAVTAGAAIVGSVGSFGMLVLGALAAF
jgi:hypothetical protein